MNTAVLFGKASDEWSTPQDFWNALHAEFAFLLDVAASTANHKCPLWLGPDHRASNYQDGLTFPWAALLTGTTGAAWMNPPYSRCRTFLAKAAAEAALGCTVVALIPSRTDTRMWHDHVWNQETHQPRPGVEIRFLKGRLKFGGTNPADMTRRHGNNSAPFPSVVIVFRPVT